MCTENVGDEDSYCLSIHSHTPDELECCVVRSAHMTLKEHKLATKPRVYINPGSIEKHLLQ